MRGDDLRQTAMWSYLSPEARVPTDHPLREMKRMVDEALERLSPRFARLYAKTGRPSIPPEQLLRALVLQVLYTVRSERLLMEELDYNLLFRWFVGLGADDPVWDPTVFTKNRERLLAGEIAQRFLAQVIAQARRRELLSDEHFSVDGTLVEAWAGQKSFRPTDEPPAPAGGSADFRGQRRRNETHRSTTDPEARLWRRGPGQEARLCYLGHALMDNRHGLAVAGAVTQAGGTAERESALALLGPAPRKRRATLGADKAYDTRELVAALREEGITPHVAQNTSGRRSAIDGRTTRHVGYATSQHARRGIERIFGWTKTVGLMRKTRHRGRRRVGWVFTFTLAVYDLVRLRTLATVAA